MKLTVQLRSHKRSAGWRFLHSAEWFFWLVGLFAIGYCAWVYVESRIYQATESREFDHERIAPTLHPIRPGSVRQTLSKGAMIGRIEIPRLEISAMVVEGVASHDLSKAVGHIPGTALPGDEGNVGIAGHRDTFFRELRNVKANDLIKVSTLDGTYEYAVESTSIVSPQSTEVLEGGKGPVLTLVTCYPFFYVGPSPNRFIVRARRVTSPDDVEDLTSGGSRTGIAGVAPPTPKSSSVRHKNGKPRNRRERNLDSPKGSNAARNTRAPE
jgi:sortase A